MTSPLSTLTPKQLRRAATIKEQILSLETELGRLLDSPKGDFGAVPTKKRTMSLAARKKIAAAQKARWAKVHSAKK